MLRELNTNEALNSFVDPAWRESRGEDRKVCVTSRAAYEIELRWSQHPQASTERLASRRRGDPKRLESLSPGSTTLLDDESQIEHADMPTSDSACYRRFQAHDGASDRNQDST